MKGSHGMMRVIYLEDAALAAFIEEFRHDPEMGFVEKLVEKNIDSAVMIMSSPIETLAGLIGAMINGIDEPHIETSSCCVGFIDHHAVFACDLGTDEPLALDHPLVRMAITIATRVNQALDKVSASSNPANPWIEKAPLN